MSTTLKNDYNFVKNLQNSSDRDFPHINKNFYELAVEFDADKMGDTLFIPWELTFFHGEEIFDNLSDDKKLMLNRLSWCQQIQNNHQVEAGINVISSELAHKALKDGQIEITNYVFREVAEEIEHLKAFNLIVKKVLTFYNISFDEFTKNNNDNKDNVEAFYIGHRIIGKLLGHYNFYYFSRTPMNIAGRSFETWLLKEENLNPTIKKIMENHYQDEARHMSCSKLFGKQAIKETKLKIINFFAIILYSKYMTHVSSFGAPYKNAPTKNKNARIGMLCLCGVNPKDARDAYNKYKSQSSLSDCVRDLREYVLRQNLIYLEQFSQYKISLKIAKFFIRRSLIDDPQVLERVKRLL